MNASNVAILKGDKKQDYIPERIIESKWNRDNDN
jgi:hypothetical protein